MDDLSLSLFVWGYRVRARARPERVFRVSLPVRNDTRFGVGARGVPICVVTSSFAQVGISPRDECQAGVTLSVVARYDDFTGRPTTTGTFRFAVLLWYVFEWENAEFNNLPPRRHRTTVVLIH